MSQCGFSPQPQNVAAAQPQNVAESDGADLLREQTSLTALQKLSSNFEASLLPKL